MPKTSLRVLHVAPPLFPVPPIGYGGVERAVDELIHAQHSQSGVEPELVAAADSVVRVPLHSAGVSIRSRGLDLTDDNYDELFAPWARLIRRMSGSVDLIHVHGTLPIRAMSHYVPECPVVVSIYCDTSDPAEVAEIRKIPSDWAVIANSDRTRTKAPDLPWHSVVLEGLRVADYPFSAEKNGRLAFLGELIPIKGAHIAIEVAKRTGRALDLAGRWERPELPPADREKQRAYLEEHITPQIDGEQIRYLGEMGPERLDLLSGASALLSPIQWEEPFGRALIEAMACGTPVVAFGLGAIPEVVGHQASGYVVHDVDSMVRAVDQLDAISPHACREHVERRFDIARVADDYLDVYRSVLGELETQTLTPKDFSSETSRTAAVEGQVQSQTGSSTIGAAGEVSGTA